MKLDFIAALERILPENIRYHHNDKWKDGNGHSHIRASFIGQSKSFPIVDDNIPLGMWQQIVLIDFDNRPRHRKVILQIIGTK